MAVTRRGKGLLQGEEKGCKANQMVIEWAEMMLP